MEETLQRSSAPAGIATAVLAILLAGCGAGSGFAATQPVPSGLAGVVAAAEDGLCRATAVLPDIEAARREFMNVAHAALHQLAAAPDLARTLAARVLETMQVVERDIAAGADAATLGPDLDALRTSTGAAIADLGLGVPACAP